MITHTFATAEGDVWFVAVRGEADIAEIRQRIAPFVQATEGVLVLDLRGLESLGHWSLAELLRLGRLVERRRDSVVTLADPWSAADRLATFVAGWLQPVHVRLADGMREARARLAGRPLTEARTSRRQSVRLVAEKGPPR